jgi:hypothetical protein
MRHLLLSLRLSLCVLFLIFLVSTNASAQFRAGVQGSVTDAQGGAIVGATVTLTSNETNKSQQTTTSDEGFYRFTGLAPGSYKIIAEQTGFNKKTFDNLNVNAEAVQGVNITLEAAGVTADVTVTDVLTPALQTENGNVDRAISTQEVRRLPQFGRDPYELTRLTPGVFGDFSRGGNGGANNLPNTTGPGGSAPDRLIFQTENVPQISANGQRVAANNYQIDGTSVNSQTHGGGAVITPNQESIKEVRVIANNYSAEYGRNSGAQVLTVSQNGTNEFHGSLFLKNNSPGLNAFNKYGGPGLNGSKLPGVKNLQHYNQYGGSIGGPLPLPRFGEGAPPAFKLARDKVFFFFSYEALRNNTVGTFNGFVETPQFRQLVTSTRPGSVTAQILGAQGIAPRIIGVIPVTCAAASTGFNAGNCRQVAGGLDIGSLAGAAGQYLNVGSPGGGFDNVPDILFAQIATPNSSQGKQYNPRIDINLTSKDTLAISSYISRFHAVQSDTDIGAGARPMADVETKPSNYFAMLTYARTISATTFNEARINFTRFAFNEIQSSSTTNFGLPRIEIESLPISRIKFGAPWSETTPGIFAENTFEVRDTLRKSLGNQGLSFGGEWRQEQDNNNLIGGARPLYTFGGLFNFANSTPLFYQIDADPRTGGPPEAQRYFRNNNYAFFAQDDWKVKPNFTLNLGLRWEYFGPLTEKQGRISNLVLGANGLADARLVTSDQLYPGDKNNFGPRLGFAWSPNKVLGLETTDKLVIRGGAAIAYNRIPTVLFANSRGNPPFFARYTICCGTNNEFSTPFADNQILYAVGANNTPFSYPANPALRLTFNPTTGIPTNTQAGVKEVEIWGAPAHVPTPYVYVYSLEGQYSLPANLTATLGYQGSASRKLVRIVNERFEFPNNDYFAKNVFFPTPDTNANYNALLASLSRRFARGFQFDANYRWSKSIDIVSSEEVGAATNPTYPLDVRQERGPSDYDVRHSLIVSALWDLPIFRNRKDAVGALLGGWQLSTIGTFHTGFPWTPVVGGCASTRGPSICPGRPAGFSGGVGNDTSNAAFITGSNFTNCPIRNATGDVIGNRCFDISDPGLRLPGVGRNSFRGPNYRDIDLSLGKRFGMAGFLGEATFFEVKANFFNVFNILNLKPFQFNSQSTQVQNVNFGRAENGLSGRVIEIQGRFSF